MSVRIRLQRHGKKGNPFYHIVVADGRAPRDGKFIEEVGTYNPMKNPAQITLDVDKAVKWLRNGAQPSDTVRSILSRKGAMLKHHLLRGVDKGALTLEAAEAKFQAWVAEKEAKVQNVIKENATAANKKMSERVEAEAKVKEAIAAKVAAKKAAAMGAAEEAATETAEIEVPVEEPVAEPAAEPAAETENA